MPAAFTSTGASLAGILVSDTDGSGAGAYAEAVISAAVAEFGTTWSGQPFCGAAGLQLAGAGVLPTTCSRWIGCCTEASAMKLTGSPESMTVCESRKNCA